MPAGKDDICPKCDKAFDINKLGSLGCSVCALWYHQKCTGLNTDLFNSMIAMYDQLGYHGWACLVCGAATKRLSNWTKVLETRLDSVEEKISNFEGTVEKVNDMGKDLASVMAEVELLKAKNCVAQANIDMNAELADQAARCDNILIHNANEPGPDITDNKQRRRFDIGIISEICKEVDIDFMGEDDIKFISRVGTIRDDGTPRPIIAGFRDRAFRDRLINMQYKLKKSRNLFKIRLVNDITKNQRENELELDKECTRRNDEIRANDRDATFLWRVQGPKGAKRLVQREEQDPRKRPLETGGEGGDGGEDVEAVDMPAARRPRRERNPQDPPSQSSRSGSNRIPPLSTNASSRSGRDNRYRR